MPRRGGSQKVQRSTKVIIKHQPLPPFFPSKQQSIDRYHCTPRKGPDKPSFSQECFNFDYLCLDHFCKRMDFSRSATSYEEHCPQERGSFWEIMTDKLWNQPLTISLSAECVTSLPSCFSSSARNFLQGVQVPQRERAGGWARSSHG